MQNYADLMFTPAVASEQQAAGTRDLYAGAYLKRTKPTLGPDEAAFLNSRSTIYLATVSSTGWPYVQHRGGPAGFVKVLDDQTIGFADYRGNRQFISKGNLSGDDRVSVFAIDYAARSRLKLQGHARMMDADTAPDIARRLQVAGQGRVERVVTIRIVAFDWNCSQYITERFDRDQVTALVGPHLAERDARIAALEARLRELGVDPDSVGV